MIDWSSLIETLTSTAIIVAALGWISSKGIEHWLRLQVENHKTSLDQQVETFKVDLKARAVQRSLLKVIARTASIPPIAAAKRS